MPYIDTKYLGKCETCRHHTSGGCNTYCDHGEEYSPNLSKIPTADVAEVVRCKDCKRCYEKRTKRNNQLMRFCMRMDGNEYQVNANDFCSYGERKEK